MGSAGSAESFAVGEAGSSELLSQADPHHVGPMNKASASNTCRRMPFRNFRSPHEDYVSDTFVYKHIGMQMCKNSPEENTLK